MEQKTIAEKMKEFIAKYPRDKFIWVNSPLQAAGDWPEHYGLGERTFKVPTDNIVETISKKGKVSRSNGWIFEMHGQWLLLKPSKLQLMHDAGVIFARDQMKRIDDGSDPQVCEIEGAAAMLSLTGLVTVTGRKRLDLRINLNVPREYLIENTETKLELRLGMKLLGIPQAYTMAELQAKEFVTFCIYSAPHATTPAERMLILQHHLGIYGPAFGTKELPSGVEVRMIEAGPDDSLEPEDAFHGSPVQEAEVEPVENGAPHEEEKPKKTDNFEFLKSMRELKTRLVRRLGIQEGETAYYTVLHDNGYEKSNLIIEREEQEKIYKALKERVRLVESNVKAEGAAASKAEEAGNAGGEKAAPVEPKEEEGSPYQFLLDARRKAFEKMTPQKLQAEIESLADGLDDDDLLELRGLESKEAMIDVAVKLVEDSIIRTAMRKAAGGRS